MGEPLLLLEAASRYRGDQEDRLTEVLAVALAEHEPFCRALLGELKVLVTPARTNIKTQQSYSAGPARIDLQIEGLDEAGRRVVLVFLEHKYSPDRSINPYGFGDEPERQQRALDSQPGDEERHLAAIVSRFDIDKVPARYGSRLSWNDVTEIAYRAGGPSGWEVAARRPGTTVAQRVLLECWNYLKGGTVGAIDAADLLALGARVRAEDRVKRLLEFVAEDLDWDEVVADDWLTASESPVQYVSDDAQEGGWLAERKNGALYVAIASSAWDDNGPQGAPHLCAGIGFTADREERAMLDESGWLEAVREVGFRHDFDSNEVWVFQEVGCAEVVDGADTLSAQANSVAKWARTIMSAALDLPVAPQMDERTKKRAKRPVRARASRSYR